MSNLAARSVRRLATGHRATRLPPCQPTPILSPSSPAYPPMARPSAMDPCAMPSAGMRPATRRSGTPWSPRAGWRRAAVVAVLFAGQAPAPSRAFRWGSRPRRGVPPHRSPARRRHPPRPVLQPVQVSLAGSRLPTAIPRPRAWSRSCGLPPMSCGPTATSSRHSIRPRSWA